MTRKLLCMAVCLILPPTILNAQCSVASLTWPLAGSLDPTHISLLFGASWTESCGGQIKLHTGIDYPEPRGTAVVAAASGRVAWVGFDTTYLGWVTINHICFTTVYWHIKPSVIKGEWIDAGTQIGTVADLATATHGQLGNHLHFGVRGWSYDNISNRGSLPHDPCITKPGEPPDPAFQEHFQDPLTISYGKCVLCCTTAKQGDAVSNSCGVPGSISVDAMLDGSPWTGSISYSLNGLGRSLKESSLGVFGGIQPGDYSLTYVSGGPLASSLSSVDPPYTQTLLSNGSINFTLNFVSTSVTTGSLVVNATLDGVSWFGPIRFQVFGPSGFIGTNLGTFQNEPIGNYVVSYLSGGPSNASIIGVNPLGVQYLAAGGTAMFTIQFQSTGTGAPSASSEMVDGVSSSTAVFHASVNPNGSSTTAQFQYDTNTSYSLSTPTESLGYGNAPLSLADSVSGLACGTTYLYYLMASNSAGSTQGPHQSFTTLACSSGPPGTITVNVTNNGQDWSLPVNFQVTGPSSLSGTSPVTLTSVVPGTYSIKYVSGGITGLTATILPSATQTLASGDTIGFTFSYIIPETPSLRSSGLTNTSATGAIVSAVVNPNALPTSVYVQYGTTANYGNNSESVNIGAGIADVPVSVQLSGLTCNTTYHYSVYATNSNGYEYSADATFTTSVCVNTGTSFYTITPCRVLDTRNGGSQGFAAMSGTTIFMTGFCGIPTTATAVALNVTVTAPTASGYVTVFPGIGIPPSTITVPFSVGQTRAVSTVVGLNSYGADTAYAWMYSGQGNVHVIIDVSGYFQ